ncbi:MAG TPA: hypothetical protein VII52_08230 [Gemmatimonadaceae bacterium]
MPIRRPRTSVRYAPPDDPSRETARSREGVPRLAIESLLIVLSVLLGFAANQWHDRRAERALVAQALTGFRRELNENLETLQRVPPKHLEMSNRLKAAAATPKPGQTARAAVRRDGAAGDGVG